MSAQKKQLPKVTKLQTVEFAQVVALVLLGLALYYKKHDLFVAAFIITIISLTIPKVFYPFAIGWFALSKFLSAISSKILMSVVFFVIVVPVGVFRRLTGVDNLKLRQFKKSRASVLVDRDHLYEEHDFLNTF